MSCARSFRKSAAKGTSHERRAEGHTLLESNQFRSDARGSPEGPSCGNRRLFGRTASSRKTFGCFGGRKAYLAQDDAAQQSRTYRALSAAPTGQSRGRSAHDDESTANARTPGRDLGIAAGKASPRAVQP